MDSYLGGGGGGGGVDSYLGGGVGWIVICYIVPRREMHQSDQSINSVSSLKQFST